MELLTILLTLLYITCIIFISSGLFRHNLIAISSSDSLPKVSVVIAARNEEGNIAKVIDDLIRQEYPLDKLEVIIVNDRSEDKTSEILKKADADYAFIKHVSIKEKSSDMTPKKFALTTGIKFSDGEIILLTDADCRLGKLWVSSMVYSIVNKNAIVIGFSEIDDSLNPSLLFKLQRLDFFSILLANAGAAGWGYFWSGTGQNLGFFKEDFISINGFNPVKDKISGDDMYLVQSISKIKSGFLSIDPNSFTKTLPAPTVKDFINQRTRWSSNSKVNYKTSPLFFTFLLIMFGLNLWLLATFIFGPFKAWLFAIKFCLDGLVIFLGSHLFDRRTDFLTYIIWSIIQPVYIPTIAFLGLRGKFSWKP